MELNFKLVLTICLAFLAGLTLDLGMPLGVAVGIVYIGPVLLTLKTPHKKVTYLVTVMGIFFTVIGFILSPEGGELWKVILNRLLAITAIVSIGLVIINVKNKQYELLKQTELLAASKQKEIKISQEKSAFLSMMSDRFRTPLSTIIGFSGLLLSSKQLAEDQIEDLNYVHEAGKSLSSVLDKTIDYIELRDGNFNVNLNTVDLLSLVKECVDDYCDFLDEKEIKIHYAEVAEINLIVFTDALLIKDVVEIILNNAIQNSPRSGNIEIEISPSSASLFRVTVRDSGNGLLSNAESTVFEPFTTFTEESNPDKRIGENLAKARFYMDALSGHIGCKNIVDNKGVEFWIDIPIN